MNLFKRKKINFKQKEQEFSNIYKKFKNETNNENLKNIINEYIEFYNGYYYDLIKYVENKKNKEIKTAKNHLIKISIIYNEMYNYTYLMLNNKYFLSYEKQKSFLKNQAFQNILKTQINEKAIKQVIYSINIKLLLSILCYKYKQEVKNQKIENDFNQILKETIEMNMYEKNNRNERMILLINAFNSFIEKNIIEAKSNIKKLYNKDIEKYKNNSFLIPLQYIGMGNNAYLTLFLPNDFKNLINETMLNNELIDINEINISNQLEKEIILENIKKEYPIGKQEDKTNKQTSIEEKTIELFK